MHTVEAIIEEDGTIRLLEHIQLPSKRRALVTILENEAPLTNLRPFGLCLDEFIVPDDFDDPLPDHILDEFEGA